MPSLNTNSTNSQADNIGTAPTTAEEVIAGESYTTEIRLKAIC